MLLDHFHPPLSDLRGWHGFHSQWAGVIAANLNQRLPDGWWAEPEAIFGIEIDVGVVEDSSGVTWEPDPVAELASWRPSEPLLTFDYAIDGDSVEIRVLTTGYGPSLMGAIELVSPSNKDRPESRDAFVSKCLSILNEGAGLIIVDVVTNGKGNLIGQLYERAGVSEYDQPGSLSVTAFHVTETDNDRPIVRVWSEPVTIDGVLPVMPLWLRVGPMLPVDFQKTYLTTCQQLKIPTPDVVSS